MALDFLYIVGGYALVFIITLVVLNILTKNFIMTYLKVKASRGRKVLIRVHDLAEVYFRAGKFNKKILHFKDINKDKHENNTVEPKHIYRHLGVNCLEYDIINSAVISPRFESIKNFDSNDADSMVNRAIMLKTLDNKLNMIIIGGFIALAIVVIIGFVLMNKNYTTLLEAVNSVSVGVV